MQDRLEAERLMEEQHGYNTSQDSYHEQLDSEDNQLLNRYCDRCGNMLDDRDDADYFCEACERELTDMDYPDPEQDQP